ncbi:MAG: glucosamine-6-phosphate deaminase [Kiritimatiellia bacterium]|jgi:glucosamine-6-phosphate deaminase
MEIIIHQTAEEVAARAADFIASQLKRKSDSVLGLATGSTPVSTYAELIRRNQAGDLSFAKVTTFNLDEYVGLPPEHPQSYRSFMNQHLFKQVDIDVTRTHIPDGNAENPIEVGPAYEAMIKAAGGIDLQILGIGTDGHIAFNEPTSSLGSRTRIKTLTEQTYTDNSRFFEAGEFQPRLAITMGIKTILEARRILLLATGAAKAQAIADMVEGPIAAICPASVLQMHEKTTVIIDEAAASKLKLKTYYTWVLGQQDQIRDAFGSAW